MTQAQPSTLPRNAGREQAGEWWEVTHLRVAAPGQTATAAAETLPAAGPPRPGRHAAPSRQPPASAAGPQQPSSKRPSAPGALSLDLCCVQRTCHNHDCTWVSDTPKMPRLLVLMEKELDQSGIISKGGTVRIIHFLSSFESMDKCALHRHDRNVSVGELECQRLVFKN